MGSETSKMRTDAFRLATGHALRFNKLGEAFLMGPPAKRDLKHAERQAP